MNVLLLILMLMPAGAKTQDIQACVDPTERRLRPLDSIATGLTPDRSGNLGDVIQASLEHVIRSNIGPSTRASLPPERFGSSCTNGGTALRIRESRAFFERAIQSAERRLEQCYLTYSQVTGSNAAFDFLLRARDILRDDFRVDCESDPSRQYWTAIAEILPENRPALLNRNFRIRINSDYFNSLLPTNAKEKLDPRIYHWESTLIHEALHLAMGDNGCVSRHQQLGLLSREPQSSAQHPEWLEDRVFFTDALCAPFSQRGRSARTVGSEVLERHCLEAFAVDRRGMNAELSPLTHEYAPRERAHLCAQIRSHHEHIRRWTDTDFTHHVPVAITALTTTLIQHTDRRLSPWARMYESVEALSVQIHSIRNEWNDLRLTRPISVDERLGSIRDTFQRLGFELDSICLRPETRIAGQESACRRVAVALQRTRSTWDTYLARKPHGFLELYPSAQPEPQVTQAQREE